MGRIRSIFPGLWTDEAFAPLSADAQVLWLGLLTEADDNGVFEWKPIGIQIRLRPTKPGSVEALLQELCDARLVARFDVDGKPYGAIRNFRKYQRPRRPKVMFPMPDDMVPFVGTSHALTVTETDNEGMDFPRDTTAADRKARSRDKKREEKSRFNEAGGNHSHALSVTDGDSGHALTVTETDNVTDETLHVPTMSVMSRQREEGGGKRKKERKDICAVADATRTPSSEKFEEFWREYPRRKGANPKKPALERFSAKVKAGADPDRIIAGVKRCAVVDSRFIGTEFIPQAVKWLKDERWNDYLDSSAPPQAEPLDASKVSPFEWQNRVSFYRKQGFWEPSLGPTPREVGCLAPPEILREFGFQVPFNIATGA